MLSYNETFSYVTYPLVYFLRLAKVLLRSLTLFFTKIIFWKIVFHLLKTYLLKENIFKSLKFRDKGPPEFCFSVPASKNEYQQIRQQLEAEFFDKPPKPFHLLEKNRREQIEKKRVAGKILIF